jgi:hypothetical protein
MNTVNESDNSAGCNFQGTRAVRPARFGYRTQWLAAAGGALFVDNPVTGMASVLVQVSARVAAAQAGASP